MNKTILVTVSDDRLGRKGGQYKATQDKIHRLLYGAGMFDYIQQFTIEEVMRLPKPLIADAMLKNIDPSINGRVYKPLVIQHVFDQMSDGDYLVYNDCSPDIWQLDDMGGNHFDIRVLHTLCSGNNGILTQFVKWDTRTILRGGLGIHTHRNFTTDLCLRTMEMELYSESFMHSSGMIVIQKNRFTKDFIELWMKYNCIPYCASFGNPNLPGDYSYWAEEDENKMGHRHDQSISGLLVNMMNPLCIDYHPIPGIPAHNFLNYCSRTLYGSQLYKFIDTNTIYNDGRIQKGDYVINKAGVRLKVYEIRSDMEGSEWYIVGLHRESCDKVREVDLIKAIQF